MPEGALSQLLLTSLAYLNQQITAATLIPEDSSTKSGGGTWLSELYFRLLKLPSSNPVTSLLMTLLNAHSTFLKNQRDAHLQLIVHMMSKSVSLLSLKVANQASPYEYRTNALKVLKFYLMGYRMQAKYFTDNCDTY